MTKVTCACGRDIAWRNFRPHARKCYDQLAAWAVGGHAMYLLDERSEAEKAKRPLPNEG